MEKHQFMNRDSLEYIEAVVKKKSQNDGKEDVIRLKIADLVLQEEWSKKSFLDISQLQISYLKDMLKIVNNPQLVHDKTQEAVKKVSLLLKSKILEGGENLNAVNDKPILIMTNHFGAYKLTAINPLDDLGVDIVNYDAMYPYIMYFAALYPVSELTNNNIYYVSEDFPLVFGKIHTQAGFLHVPPSSISLPKGRTAFLQDQTRDAISNQKNVAIVNFPEGGTSGKYSGLSPYDLDPFKTGGYVVAANLRIHVVHVAQYFDKDDGFQLKVFEPFIPEIGDKSYYDQIASKGKDEMQKWLNKKK